MAKKQKPIRTTLLRQLDPLTSAIRSGRRGLSGSDTAGATSARTKASQQETKQKGKLSKKVAWLTCMKRW